MIKVLVIDDSAFMRKVLSDMINEEESLEVVDTARNGEEAFKKIEQSQPHVITLDLNMPQMDGLEFMRQFFTKYKMPIIVVSSYTQTKRSDKTIQALELGAFDFVPKPSGEISLDMETVKNDLQEKIKLAAGVTRKNKVKMKAKKIHILPTPGVAKDKIVFLGASTGGPRAIKDVITTFPNDFPTAILIVQHMPAGFTSSFAKRLDELSLVNVREALDGDRLESGLALIAPGDYHMVLEKNQKLRLLKTPRIHGVRPAVDITLESIANLYREKTIAVILTGMGRDGANAMQQVKKYGGRTIVQDAESSIVFGMPKATIDMQCADLILPLDKIGPAIMESL